MWRSSKHGLLVGLLSLCPLLVTAQKPVGHYPTDFFQFPLRPGEHNLISGTLAELRPNHFHAGLDIKTDLRTGFPVHACADGYILRAKVSPYGYGRVLYIVHPGKGYQTVYAHLEDFTGVMDSLVRSEQYRVKSFSVDMTFPPGEYPVEKGQVIAHSGNTGSSASPHLHFEIRDAASRPLNPLFFQFPEVRDHIPPTLLKLAIEPLDIDSRIQQRFARVELAPQMRDSVYRFDQPIQVYGKLGLQLDAVDRLDGAPNPDGITAICLEVDSVERWRYFAEKISYAERHCYNAHVDYHEAATRGAYFHRLYKHPKNCFSGLYTQSPEGGLLDIQDTLAHTVRITVWDAYQNKSTLVFTLKGTRPLTNLADPVWNKGETEISHQVVGHFLQVRINNPESHSTPAEFFFKGHKQEVPSAYFERASATYLWDLRGGLPDSMDFCGVKYAFPFEMTFVPGGAQTFKSEAFDLRIPSGALIDTLYLAASSDESGWDIGDGGAAFHHDPTITLYPTTVIENKAKTRIYSRNRYGRLGYEGGTWSGNAITFEADGLGRFELHTDTQAPKITSMRDLKGEAQVRVRDNLSGIGAWSATCNGEWVLLNYDYIEGRLWTERSDPKVPIKGDLVFSVCDNVGNCSSLRVRR